MPQNLVQLVGILSLGFSLPVSAQFKTPSARASVEQAAHASAADAKTVEEPKPEYRPSSNVHVLNDLKGFNLQPYLDTLLPIVRDEWYAAIHEVVKNPTYRNGTVTAEFKVMRSGDIQELKIAQSSGEEDLDLAVTQALHKANPFPEIPKALPSDEVHLRMNFFYKGKKPSKWWRR
jgi:TonB family protein